MSRDVPLRLREYVPHRASNPGRLLAHMRRTGVSSLSPLEVAEFLQISAQSVPGTLVRVLQAGLLCKRGHGVGCRYSLPEDAHEAEPEAPDVRADLSAPRYAINRGGRPSKAPERTERTERTASEVEAGRIASLKRALAFAQALGAAGAARS